LSTLIIAVLRALHEIIAPLSAVRPMIAGRIAGTLE
jgi:hypothetical protein